MDLGRVDDVLLGLVVDEVNLHGLDVEVGGRNGRWVRHDDWCQRLVDARSSDRGQMRAGKDVERLV